MNRPLARGHNKRLSSLDHRNLRFTQTVEPINGSIDTGLLLINIGFNNGQFVLEPDDLLHDCRIVREGKLAQRHAELPTVSLLCYRKRRRDHLPLSKDEVSFLLIDKDTIQNCYAVDREGKLAIVK